MLLCALVLQITVQAQDQKKYFYESKVHKYTNLRNAGIGLTVCGSVLTVVGISTMSSAVAEDLDFVTDEGISKFTTGYLCTTLGITASGGGIVLWAIGGSKKKSYSNKLNVVSLNINPSSCHLVSLAFHF